MAKLGALLAKGYFPKELPPCFSTEQFAAAAENQRSNFRTAFERPPSTRCCPYSLARTGHIRRPLRVPNPIQHFRLCDCIDSNWPALAAFTSASPISISTPTPGPSGKRAVLPRLSHGALLFHRALNLSGYEYVLKTDIADFYSSVYTHSIPWALHSKPVAKAKRRDLTLLGNLLDLLVRSAQDDQTVGIPIGPDTSLVISEIIASAADNQLDKRIAHLRGYRHYDDYELLCRSAGDAQELISILQDELHKFELRLNPSKTEVHQAPMRLEEEWVSTLRRFQFGTNPRSEADDLVRYFDLVGDYVREHSSKHVMKFSLGRFRKRTTHTSNWHLFQSLLCQALISDPSAISQFVAILDHHQSRGYAISRDLIEPLLNDVIGKCAPFHFHEEVSWALWALLAFEFAVSEDAAAAISRVDNSMVALLALDAQQQGRVNGGIDTAEWENRMGQDELFQEQWLLSYEANVKGWLPSQRGTDHVLADPFFRELKNRDIQFYSPVVGTRALAASLAMREEWFYWESGTKGTPNAGT